MRSFEAGSMMRISARPRYSSGRSPRPHFLAQASSTLRANRWVTPTSLDCERASLSVTGDDGCGVSAKRLGSGNELCVLFGLSHQQLKLVLSMGTADMLEGRTLFSLVPDYLDDSRSGLGPNGSDCQSLRACGQDTIGAKTRCQKKY